MPPVVTSPWGWRVHPVTGERRWHSGADLRFRQGEPVQPIAVGVVSRVIAPQAGNTGIVEVLHPWGWRSRYVHLSRVLARPGQLVSRGAPLGLAGGTPGTPGAGVSTGPHLHLEITFWNGAGWTSVDPARVLEAA